MRLIDADELMEHVWRDKLDCRGLIAEMVNKAPTVKVISTNIPISIFERLNSQEPCEDKYLKEIDHLQKYISKLETQIVEQKPKTYWIPVSERLPEDTNPVNITWVNHNPESYYADIKDKPFTATGHYCNGRWWWYSVTCQDYLDEYGHWDIDAMDDAIEVIAWMPLPEPYKAESEDKA